MCSECLQVPCHPRCPNAPEPATIFRCKYCGEGIVEGEEYVEVDGTTYHRDCLEGMMFDECLTLLGYEVKEAEVCYD